MEDLESRTLQVDQLPSGFLKSEGFLRELKVKLAPLMPGGVVEQSMIDYITLSTASAGRTYGELRQDFAEFFGDDKASGFSTWLWTKVENEIQGASQRPSRFDRDPSGEDLSQTETTNTGETRHPSISQTNDLRSVKTIRRGKSDSDLSERGRRAERVSSANRRDHSRSRDPPRLHQRQTQDIPFRRGRGFNSDNRRRSIVGSDGGSSSMQDTQFVVHLGQSRGGMAMDRPRVVVTMPDEVPPPIHPRHSHLNPRMLPPRMDAHHSHPHHPAHQQPSPLHLPREPPFRVRLSILRSDKAEQRLLQRMATDKRGYQMIIVNSEQCLVNTDDCRICWHFWSIHGCRNGQSCLFTHELPSNPKVILELVPPMAQKPELLMALYMSNQSEQYCFGKDPSIADIATPEQWIYQKLEEKNEPVETKLSRVTVQMPRDFVDEDEEDEEEEESHPVGLGDGTAVDSQNGGKNAGHPSANNQDPNANGASDNNDGSGNDQSKYIWVLSDSRLSDIPVELTDEVARALSGLQQRSLMEGSSLPLKNNNNNNDSGNNQGFAHPRGPPARFFDGPRHPHSSPPRRGGFVANRGRGRGRGRGGFHPPGPVQRGWSPPHRGRGRGFRGGFVAPPFRGGRGRGFRGRGRGGFFRGRGGYHRGGFNHYAGGRDGTTITNGNDDSNNNDNNNDDIATINGGSSTTETTSPSKSADQTTEEAESTEESSKEEKKVTSSVDGDENGNTAKPEANEGDQIEDGGSKPAKKREIELCKFNEFCTRKDCFYRHTKARRAFRNDHLTQTVRLTSGERSSIVCKFDLRCTRIGCVYRHPQRDSQTSQWFRPLQDESNNELKPSNPDIPAVAQKEGVIAQ